MLAEERLSRIMKLLSQQRTATVQELCEALDASAGFRILTLKHL